jgi:hypothetical protein
LVTNYANAEHRILLALGKIHDSAHVTVNGHSLPPIWFPPYTVDITPHCTEGMNEIRVVVTIPLRNCLVGYGLVKGSSYGTHKKMPLKPAGILGVPRIVVIRE